MTMGFLDFIRPLVRPSPTSVAAAGVALVLAASAATAQTQTQTRIKLRPAIRRGSTLKHPIAPHRLVATHGYVIAFRTRRITCAFVPHLHC